MLELRVINETQFSWKNNTYNIDNVSTELLEEVVKESLKDNVSYIYNDAEANHPLQSLFKDFENSTDKSSEFRKKYDEYDSEYDKATSEVKSLEEDVSNLHSSL